MASEATDYEKQLARDLVEHGAESERVRQMLAILDAVALLAARQSHIEELIEKIALSLGIKLT